MLASCVAHKTRDKNHMHTNPTTHAKAIFLGQNKEWKVGPHHYLPSLPSSYGMGQHRWIHPPLPLFHLLFSNSISLAIPSSSVATDESTFLRPLRWVCCCFYLCSILLFLCIFPTHHPVLVSSLSTVDGISNSVERQKMLLQVGETFNSCSCHLVTTFINYCTCNPFHLPLALLPTGIDSIVAKWANGQGSDVSKTWSATGMGVWVSTSFIIDFDLSLSII